MTTEPQKPAISALSVVVALGAFTGFATTIIWALTGVDYYWPRWVWLGWLAAIAPLGVAAHATVLPAGSRRRLILHADVSGAVAGCLLLIWWFAGAGLFWPVWPFLGLALLLGLHAMLHYRHQFPLFVPRRQLADRVETLTRSRRGALDVQAAELRRIERDLHDGAQARLVALSMQLGRAEIRLQDNPEAAALVKAAREQAGAAIAELRDLARGIAPPVLTDRGLAAAVQSLIERSPAPVTITGHRLDGRLPPAVETAAYFVVAEALTNVAKHAPGAAARVAIEQHGDVMVIDVADDGPGGADPAGSGLNGLRARVAALDGTLSVVSPSGGPTVIHVELPCES